MTSCWELHDRAGGLSRPIGGRTAPPVGDQGEPECRSSSMSSSPRPGPAGSAHNVASGIHEFAWAHGGIDAALVDLDAFGLPIYDEPKHPRFKDYQHDHTKAWSASVASADGFVFVIAGLHYTPPPSFGERGGLSVFLEWNYKVAGIVSYGGPLAGRGRRRWRSDAHLGQG